MADGHTVPNVPRVNARRGSRPGDRHRARHETSATAPRSAPPLVLVVDDDPSVRKALQRLFRSAAYPVETFASAAEFLAYDVPAGAACLVLDIRMPGISGLDLQQQLAATRPELPIVVITGHADAETRQRALAGGAVAVLYKPFDDQALLDAVARAIVRGGA